MNYKKNKMTLNWYTNCSMFRRQVRVQNSVFCFGKYVVRLISFSEIF